MKNNLQFTSLAGRQAIYNLQLIFLVLLFPLSIFAVTPTASPSATIAPTGPEEEKVQQMRQIVKDISEIKEKIEKKAYVGTVLEITDSTLTVNNFRGKQRVRISEETTIIGTSKKEIATKDLAVDDKIIAMGQPDNNETLEAKRIIVVAPVKTTPVKRLVFYGTISEANSKTSTFSLTSTKDPNQILPVKIDKTTNLIDQKDPKNNLTLKSFKEGQKLIVVYPEVSEGKIPLAKTIFLLP